MSILNFLIKGIQILKQSAIFVGVAYGFPEQLNNMPRRLIPAASISSLF